MTSTEHKDEDKAAKKVKFDGLKKLSASQLADLLKAVSAEVEARAKTAADKKPLSKMSSREFYKSKLFSGKDDDDGK